MNTFDNINSGKIHVFFQNSDFKSLVGNIKNTFDIFFLGDATLSVIPSTNVIVNQTISLQCIFISGQLGVHFNFPGYITCFGEFGRCARGCVTLSSIECPNNQTYILNVTVLPSWHNATFSCEPLFGGLRSKITLNVTGMVCTCLIVQCTNYCA